MTLSWGHLGWHQGPAIKAPIGHKQNTHFLHKGANQRKGMSIKGETSYLWEHYRNQVVGCTAALVLPAVSIVLSRLGIHFAAVCVLGVATVLLVYTLRTSLAPIKLPGIMIGLGMYAVLFLVFIYCFSNIYVERGIISDGHVTHDRYDAIYFSFATTLGYGDSQPTPAARLWTLFEAYSGYFFLAFLVILISGQLTSHKGRFSPKTAKREPHQEGLNTWQTGWAMFSAFSFIALFVTADILILQKLESSAAIIALAGLTVLSWFAFIGLVYLAGWAVAWVRRGFT